jgi:hypothetical protein
MQLPTEVTVVCIIADFDRHTLSLPPVSAIRQGAYTDQQGIVDEERKTGGK